MGVRNTKIVLTKHKNSNFKNFKSHIIMNKKKNSHECRKDKVIHQICFYTKQN